MDDGAARIMPAVGPGRLAPPDPTRRVPGRTIDPARTRRRCVADSTGCSARAAAEARDDQADDGDPPADSLRSPANAPPGAAHLRRPGALPVAQDRHGIPICKRAGPPRHVRSSPARARHGTARSAGRRQLAGDDRYAAPHRHHRRGTPRRATLAVRRNGAHVPRCPTRGLRPRSDCSTCTTPPARSPTGATRRQPPQVAMTGASLQLVRTGLIRRLERAGSTGSPRRTRPAVARDRTCWSMSCRSSVLRGTRSPGPSGGRDPAPRARRLSTSSMAAIVADPASPRNQSRADLGISASQPR